MKLGKVLVIISILILFLGTGAAYTGGSGLTTTECNDGLDNDGDGETDASDSGCTRPYSEDNSEGHIWDTDLSAVTYGGGSFDLSQTQSVFFQGSVNIEHQDTSTASQLTEQYIDDVYNGDQYGNGERQTTDLSGSFPEGTVFLQDENRVVDPPNPGKALVFDNNAVKGNEVTCGDGRENEDISKTGDNTNPTPEETDCRADYGRIKEMYDAGLDLDTEGPYNHKGSPGMKCVNDEAYCTSASASCSSGCTDASCYFDPGGDKGYMEENTYWQIDNGGESIYRKDCTRDSTNTVDSASGASTGCCETDRYGNCIDSGCSASGDSEGDKRSWEEKDRLDCNALNVVDGGGDLGGSEIGQYNEEYPNKADNDPAGTYTDFTAHNYDDGVDSGKVWCGWEETVTVDADGPKGNGDGWVVIEGGSIVATESPDGSNMVGKRVSVSVDGEDPNFENHRNAIGTGCPNDKQVCLRYADFYTQPGSGTMGSPEWTGTSDGAVQVDSTAYTADESYSVCKAINRINRENGDGEGLMECDFETSGTSSRNSGGGTNAGNRNKPCGDDPNEFTANMEGPAVDETILQDNPRHYEACVDEISDCVLRGKEVSEGNVSDVSPVDNDNQYEMGGNSPDREVCLNIDEGNTGGTGDEVDADNLDDDHDGDIEEQGGEWYSLDSETAQDYLRDNPGIISSGSDDNPRHIAYYWRENLNPQHPDYNPEGGSEGIALEDDCGPNVEGCNKVDDSANKEPTFFNFLPESGDPEEGVNDIHYNPTGGDEEGSPNVRNSFFQPHGQLNKIQDASNQLEPGMDTTYPGDQFLSGVDIWSNSIATENEADQYALTQYLNWSISNRGNAYAPGSAPYHKDYNGLERTNKQDNTVSKQDKVFGNSFADVNNQGQGIWIDPDDIKERWDNSGWGTSTWSSWKQKLNFKNDLTGPDLGYGFDLESKNLGSPELRSSGNIVIADIVFQDEFSGGNEYLEKPACGDDQREYLLEERGETNFSAEDNGRYACADSRDYCVQRDYQQGVYEPGRYLQANEPGEDNGRLKQDEEYCMELAPDQVPNWYDQDYNQQACNENTLFDEQGVRWFSAEDVKDHPDAFTGGIDDDTNPKLRDEGRADITAEPRASGWNTNSESPASSGTMNTHDDISTLGFCGGDDESEYLVTQTCTSRFCETNNSIQGVARDPNNCVLDAGEVDGVSGSERDLYDEGEQVTVNTGSATETLACYGGAWHRDWPIVFLRDKAEVPLGTDGLAAFQVINVEDSGNTFDLELEDGPDGEDLDAFTSFTETGTDKMNVTVPAQSSRTFNLEIRGNSIMSTDQVLVEASARSGSLSGQDNLDVEIIDSSASSSSNTTQRSRDIPGIGIIQLTWLTMVATFTYFLFISRRM